MEVIEGIKSNEWFHLIDHMYAKWPKINLPFITNIEETKGGSHLIPEARGATQRRQNTKRKRGRKRKSIQKPIKKRSIPISKSQQKIDGRKDDPVVRAPRVAPIPVPRRISIIQTRAQKGSGGVRVGLHFRHCSCCEGNPALVKSSVPKSAKSEGNMTTPVQITPEEVSTKEEETMAFYKNLLGITQKNMQLQHDKHPRKF